MPSEHRSGSLCHSTHNQRRTQTHWDVEGRAKEHSKIEPSVLVPRCCLPFCSSQMPIHFLTNSTCINAIPFEWAYNFICIWGDAKLNFFHLAYHTFSWYRLQVEMLPFQSHKHAYHQQPSHTALAKPDRGFACLSDF